MIKYRSYRVIDGKPRWTIVDENGNIINKNPNKEELKSLNNDSISRPKITNGIYNSTNICEKIKEDGERCENILVAGRTCKEKDENGKLIYICNKCYMSKYCKNIDRKKDRRERYISDRRTGNLDPDSEQAKGDNFQLLTCKWKKLIDLNKENDDYRSPIDCVDPMTGLKYQVKGSLYNRMNRRWAANFKDERSAIERGFEFDKLIYYCTDNDGKLIERVYIFPIEEILKRTGVSIYKYDSIGRLYKNGWYEKYRVKDEDTLKIINDIWRNIIIKRKRIKKGVIIDES